MPNVTVDAARSAREPVKVMKRALIKAWAVLLTAGVVIGLTAPPHSSTPFTHAGPDRFRPES
jgi:hypothetical protein